MNGIIKFTIKKESVVGFLDGYPVLYSGLYSEKDSGEYIRFEYPVGSVKIGSSNIELVSKAYKSRESNATKCGRA